MRLLIAILCLSLCSAYGVVTNTTPELLPQTANFNVPSDVNQWHIKTKEGQNGIVQKFTTKNGENFVANTNLHPIFYMGPQKSSLLAHIDGTYSGSTVTITFTSNFLARPVSSWYSALKLYSGTTNIYSLSGLITIEDSPEIDSGTLAMDRVVSWLGKTFFGTVSNGPYRFPTSTLTTNSDGSVNVTPVLSGSESDPVYTAASSQIIFSNNPVWTSIINGTYIDDVDLTGYVQTNDARLSDARVPLSHNQAASTITNAPWLLSFTESDPVSQTQVWSTAQYDQAILIDGSRELTAGLPWAAPSGGWPFTAVNLGTPYPNSHKGLFFCITNVSNPILQMNDNFVRTLKPLYIDEGIVVNAGSLDIGGGEITNAVYRGDNSSFPDLNIASSYNYQIGFVSGKELWIEASAAGVTSSIAGTTISLNIPAGVRPVRLTGFWPVQAGGFVLIDTGTNYWPCTGNSDRCIPSACNVWRTDGSFWARSFSGFPLPNSSTFTQFKVSGFSAEAANAFVIDLGGGR